MQVHRLLSLGEGTERKSQCRNWRDVRRCELLLAQAHLMMCGLVIDKEVKVRHLSKSIQFMQGAPPEAYLTSNQTASPPDDPELVNFGREMCEDL